MNLRKMKLFFILIPLLGLSACQIITPFTAEEPPTAQPVVEDDASAPPDMTPEVDVPAEELTVNEEESIVLTVWVPQDLDPTAGTPFGEALIDLLADFDQEYPDIQVEVERKRISGPGGMLSYLRTAPPVAPDILPDLVMMDRENAVIALNENLIIPLSAVSDDFDSDTLYPAAAEIARAGSDLISWPYLLEVQHLIYRKSIFVRPPCDFNTVLAARVPLEFAAAPLTGVNQTTLQQYLASGGRLVDEDGTPVLDATVLTSLLTFYGTALDTGILNPAVFQYSTTSEIWGRYADRLNNLAVVSSTLVLTEQTEVENTAYCPIPTATGEAFSIVKSWSWMITTRDERRQEAVLSLLTFMADPVVQGNFTRASGWLPSQPEALAVWGEGPYTAFAANLLEAGIARPSSELQTRVGRSLQLALEDVLLNGLSPVQAATDAVQSFEQHGDG